MHGATRLETSATEGGGRPGGAQLSSRRADRLVGRVGAQGQGRDGSVSACTLAPVARVVDVEEGLPEVGPPLIHVGC